MKNYIVAIDIEICGDIIKHYVEIKAENQQEAYKKTQDCISSSLNILIEKKPIESL